MKTSPCIAVQVTRKLIESRKLDDTCTVIRWTLVLLFTAAALAQKPQSDQKPRWQPGWPCTGKEPAFDPTFARVAEASGGQLFLFDRSEARSSTLLITATSRHRETVARVTGKLDEPYRDIRVPVDSSIDSLLVSVSLQCMQMITIYGPSGLETKPEQLGGENHWFRAGRIATVPNPAPGLWTIRLNGAGPFFLSVQAHASLILQTPRFESSPPRLDAENLVAVSLNAPSPDVRFRLVNASGETLQSLPLEAVEGRPGIFSGRIVPGFREFRILAEGTDEHGFAFQRVDPRLIEATAGVP
jgi:hypothetical protein